jgi:hypothetical protein
MTLTQELYARLRTALLQCGEFDNHHSLRAVFVTTELSIYQNGLPQSNSKEDLVSQTIAYLLPLRLSDNRPVLPLFLAELWERRYVGDALRDELNGLHGDVAQALSDKVIIPFVVAAMTHAEAADLLTETVFDNPDVAPGEHARFQHFKQALEEEIEHRDWHSCYGERRESWKPLASPETSIGEIISGMLNHVNDYHQELQNLPRLLPYFLSDEFFSTEREIRRQTLRQLRQLGGVLIIDAVSIFHPTLNRSISHAGIGSSKRVAILIVSPIDTSILPVNRLIEEVIDLQMETVFTRFGH